MNTVIMHINVYYISVSQKTYFTARRCLWGNMPD